MSATRTISREQERHDRRVTANADLANARTRLLFAAHGFDKLGNSKAHMAVMAAIAAVDDAKDAA